MTTKKEETVLTFAQATVLLSRAVRHELKDTSFGDSEFTWVNVKIVASGYFGRSDESVSIGSQVWKGHLARLLRKCGRPGKIELNNEPETEVYDSELDDYGMAPTSRGYEY